MSRRPPTTAAALPTAVALLAVYVVWGSTYLAIAFVVDTMPPFLSAGLRFVLAGAIIVGALWLLARIRGRGRFTWPTAAQWRSAAIVGTLLLLGGNGLVVLAERPGFLPSGIAAVLVATVPIWLNVFDALLDRRRPSLRVLGGVLAGFVGVIILLLPADGAAAINPVGVLLVVVAAVLWSAGSLYQRRAAQLPRSAFLATGMEMFTGGIALVVAGLVTGELGRTSVASFSGESVAAFVYLVLVGSLVGFSAYIWLLGNAPVSTAATYAYVNPIVAVALGAWLRSEPLTIRTGIAAAIIIAAVVAMVTGRPAPLPNPPADEAADSPDVAPLLRDGAA